MLDNPYLPGLAAELDCLAAALRRLGSDLELPADPIAAKTLLTIELRAATARFGGGTTETAWRDGGASDGVAHDLPSGFRMTWRYQRGDLQWVSKDPLADLYEPPGQDGCRSTGVLTGSGMGAVAAVLGALDRTYAGARGRYSANIYFETKLYMNTWSRGVAWSSEAAEPDVAWCDSFGRCDDLDLGMRAEVAVLDTTCYAREDTRIGALLGARLAQGLVTVLVRSHSKLDMLGTEFARLGSAVFIYPPRLPHKEMRRLNALIGAAYDWILRTGVIAGPQCVPPFWAEGRFRPLTADRNRRLRAAHHALAQTTSEDSRYRVVHQHHHVFATLDPLDAEANIEVDVEDLACLLRAAGMQASVCPSFGFDFIALDLLRKPGGGREIRIALPGLAGRALHHCLETVAAWSTRP